MCIKLNIFVTAFVCEQVIILNASSTVSSSVYMSLVVAAVSECTLDEWEILCPWPMEETPVVSTQNNTCQYTCYTRPALSQLLC